MARRGAYYTELAALPAAADWPNLKTLCVAAAGRANGPADAVDLMRASRDIWVHLCGREVARICVCVGVRACAECVPARARARVSARGGGGVSSGAAQGGDLHLGITRDMRLYMYTYACAYARTCTCMRALAECSSVCVGACVCVRGGSGRPPCVSLCICRSVCLHVCIM